MLILLRHGQTTSNVTRALDTALPGADLTELGQQQARDAGAEIIKRFAPARIATSQAIRAQHTGRQAFGAYLEQAGAELEELVGIQEISAGRFEMQNSPEAHLGYLSSVAGYFARNLDAQVDGGETLTQFLGRYRAGLRPYEEAARDDNVVVVSHGGAIRAYAANATSVDSQFATRAYLPNCEYVVINPVGDFGDWELIQWGAAHNQDTGFAVD
ncbi:histidine phosphatase family protein [Corynebacterium aquatimens]|uniref:Phosphoglycerate mutase n=1 Tax=Corynebacterium aquatimens TaxID=1190508 RepID=A0A931E2Y6_9CORY|nr:histidine phosphatase family protein [Corynebacterium aquatimens]MBG6122826.1 putative phosphoglycerate mutase [Corynebacterium aquatimens]WJY66839.1 2,3-bisphosphoglycerate-dependent phosphoglycerate mutase [Corynebacterium aquatimens]